MFTPQDHHYMSLALRLAEQGRYTAHPNPRVGCVIVKNQKIIGEGAHHYAGEPHAEVHALARAGKSAQGATAYVTLEPCSHQGKTPPCASSLIAAGISHVITAMQDPNPLVSGSGLKHLNSAGITTQCGLLEAEAQQLNRGFIKRMQCKRPFVRVKLAMSLDGATAMQSGESMWITGSAARKDVQKLRAQSDAILTATGTVIDDNPSLNVRLNVDDLNLPNDSQNKVRLLQQPKRVIIDSKLSTPTTAKLLKLEGETWIFTISNHQDKIKALHNAGAEVIVLKPDEHEPDKVPLDAVLVKLAQREINEVHVEAGATLCGALLYAGLVDEIILYMAAHIMGNNTRALFNLPKHNKMHQRIEVKIQDIRAIGDDWRISAVPTTVNSNCSSH